MGISDLVDATISYQNGMSFNWLFYLTFLGAMVAWLSTGVRLAPGAKKVVVVLYFGVEAMVAFAYIRILSLLGGAIQNIESLTRDNDRGAFVSVLVDQFNYDLLLYSGLITHIVVFICFSSIIWIGLFEKSTMQRFR